MASLNRITLIGNVGRDPETRFTTSGTPVANFSVATTERWTDKDGKKQESTEWHRVQVFAGLAEFVGKYVKKGAQVYVEGRVKTDKWEDKDGGRHERMVVDASSVQLLDRKSSAPSEDAQSEAVA